MKQLLLFLLLLPCFAIAQIQEGYLTNYVYDNNGNPMPNIFVKNKRTLKVAYTNNYGLFQIKAKLGDSVLVYKWTGLVIVKVQKGMLQSSGNANNAPSYTLVAPILSSDYDNEVNASKRKRTIGAAVNLTDTVTIKGQRYIYSYNQRIKERKGSIDLSQANFNRLYIGGSFSTGIEFKQANATPLLQHTYVQGGPQNGKVVWSGPENNIPFSFGPAASLLGYDGTAYRYDFNGRLVAAGSGKGIAANNYNNSILGTGKSIAHSMVLRMGISFDYSKSLDFSIKYSHRNEDLFIAQNNNTNNSFSATATSKLKNWSIGASYTYQQNVFSNSNRNGFLNRLYQQSLLTPISFSNEQGTALNINQQRSFSSQFDNPYFLLTNNNNGYRQEQQVGSFSVEKKKGIWLIKLQQSLEKLSERSNESYKPGTAYFNNGASLQRSMSSVNSTTQLNANMSFRSYRIRHQLVGNYIFTALATDIAYSINSNYSYRRSVHDASFTYKLDYEPNHLSVGGSFTNKFYLSNTASTVNFLLPSIGAYCRYRDVFELYGVDAKLYSTFTTARSELPIQQSLAHIALLNLLAEQSMTYFPTAEVASFNGLKPIAQNEWRVALDLSYKNQVTFTGEYFIKQVNNDVFATQNNGQLNLYNTASHRTKGWELQLSHNLYMPYYRRNKINMTNAVSFISYQSSVTDVLPNYDHMPMAGFSNVYKAIIKGQSFGAIVGNSFQRNADGKMVIGADGFPLVDNLIKPIGNPIPDFVIKQANTLSWKRWSMNMDWEWRKGGDIWNGTQAALDYYGRSQASAIERNTNNYVFDGVLQNGQPNNIPVSFYDPSQSILQTKWTRYGPTGVAEAYIQDGSNVRIRMLSLSYSWEFKKYVQKVILGSYLSNWVLWSAYKGADSNQLLLDMPNTAGLDYFNLPSTKTYGVKLTVQF